MAKSSSTSEPAPSTGDDMSELNKDLERMIESVENIAVQLTCMVYDMVTLRTSPEVGASMRRLEEAYRGCRAAVCGEPDPEAELPDPGAEIPDTRPAEPAAAGLD